MEEKKSPEIMEEEVVPTVETEAAVADTVELSQEELHGENLNDRVKVLSPMATVMKRFFRSKLSIVGLVVIIALFLFSFVGPWFSQWYDGGGRSLVDQTPRVSVDEVTITYIVENADGTKEKFTTYEIVMTENSHFVKGDISWKHLLGTNERGEDIFTNLMLGGRVSLTIGFVVVILQTLLGVLLGGLAGYFGGWVDQLIMRICDILYCIPTLPIMLILSAIFNEVNTVWKLYYMMGILCLIGWAGTARLVRGQILSLREQDFMLAAKASGLSTFSKIFKHLMPNVMPQLIVTMTLGLGQIILTEATLGFLGIGAPLGTPTWGAMIEYANDTAYLEGYPNFWLPAGICITAAILAFNFVGDGLRDAFDPKMKR